MYRWGGLVPGLELDSIFLGVSQSRNPNLAALFYRMRLIESYGTGIGKIKRGYQVKGKAPIFETAADAFRVTLPNCNEGDYASEGIQSQRTDQTSAAAQNKLVLEYACENGRISRQETEELMEHAAFYCIIYQLCHEAIL